MTACMRMRRPAAAWHSGMLLLSCMLYADDGPYLPLQGWSQQRAGSDRGGTSCQCTQASSILVSTANSRAQIICGSIVVAAGCHRGRYSCSEGPVRAGQSVQECQQTMRRLMLPLAATSASKGRQPQPSGCGTLCRLETHACAHLRCQSVNLDMLINLLSDQLQDQSHLCCISSYSGLPHMVHK